jgi:hypothetical protein
MSSFGTAYFYQRGTMRNDSKTENVSFRQWRTAGLLTIAGGAPGKIAYSSHSRATVLTLLILMTTVSCSTLDECLPSFSLPGIDPINQQLAQRDEEPPKARREQPKNSASPKVATVPAPKAKKANTSQLDTQKERQLFQEFLQWRNRQKDL